MNFQDENATAGATPKESQESDLVSRAREMARQRFGSSPSKTTDLQNRAYEVASRGVGQAQPQVSMDSIAEFNRYYEPGQQEAIWKDFYSDPVAARQRFVRSYRSLAPEAQEAMAKDYRDLKDRMDDEALSYELLQSMSSGGAVAAGLMSILEPLNLKFLSNPAQDMFNMTTRVRHAIVNDDGEVGVAAKEWRNRDAFDHANLAYNRMYLDGNADRVPSEVVEMLKTYGTANAFGQASRTVLEIEGLGAGGRAAKGIIAPAGSGLTRKAIGAAVGGVENRAGLAGYAETARLFGLHGGIQSATDAAQFRDAWEKEKLAEVWGDPGFTIQPGETEDEAARRYTGLDGATPFVLHVMTEFAKGAGISAATAIPFHAGTRAYHTGINKLTGIPRRRLAESVLTRAVDTGTKEMGASLKKNLSNWIKDKAAKGTISAVDSAFGKRVIAAGDWVSGAAGSHLMWQMMNGETPDPFGVLTEDFRVTAAVGFMFGPYGIRGVPRAVKEGQITAAEGVDILTKSLKGPWKTAAEQMLRDPRLLENQPGSPERIRAEQEIIDFAEAAMKAGDAGSDAMKEFMGRHREAIERTEAEARRVMDEREAENKAIAEKEAKARGRNQEVQGERVEPQRDPREEAAYAAEPTYRAATRRAAAEGRDPKADDYAAVREEEARAARVDQFVRAARGDKTETSREFLDLVDTLYGLDRPTGLLTREGSLSRAELDQVRELTARLEEHMSAQRHLERAQAADYSQLREGLTKVRDRLLAEASGSRASGRGGKTWAIERELREVDDLVRKIETDQPLTKKEQKRLEKIVKDHGLDAYIEQYPGLAWRVPAPTTTLRSQRLLTSGPAEEPPAGSGEWFTPPPGEGPGEPRPTRARVTDPPPKQVGRTPPLPELPSGEVKGEGFSTRLPRDDGGDRAKARRSERGGARPEPIDVVSGRAFPRVNEIGTPRSTRLLPGPPRGPGGRPPGDPFEGGPTNYPETRFTDPFGEKGPREPAASPRQPRAPLVPTKGPEAAKAPVRDLPGKRGTLRLTQDQIRLSEELAGSLGPDGTNQARYEVVYPENLVVMADEYQLRHQTDAEGSAGTVQGEYDSLLPDKMVIHRRADGIDAVINGHNRIKKIPKGTPIEAVVAYEEPTKVPGGRDIAGGVSVADAAELGAIINIKQGRFAPQDIAHVIRRMQERGATLAEAKARLESAGFKFDPRKPMVRQGLEVASLGDDAYRRVMRGEVPFEVGAEIGRMAGDNEALAATGLDLYSKAAAKAEELGQAPPHPKAVRTMLGRLRTAEEGGFEGSPETHAAYGQIVRSMLGALRREKSTFGTAARDADLIVGDIDVGANKKLAEQREVLIDALKNLEENELSQVRALDAMVFDAAEKSLANPKEMGEIVRQALEELAAWDPQSDSFAEGRGQVAGPKHIGSARKGDDTGNLFDVETAAGGGETAPGDVFSMGTSPQADALTGAIQDVLRMPKSRRPKSGKKIGEFVRKWNAEADQLPEPDRSRTRAYIRAVEEALIEAAKKKRGRLTEEEIARLLIDSQAVETTPPADVESLKDSDAGMVRYAGESAEVALRALKLWSRAGEPQKGFRFHTRENAQPVTAEARDRIIKLVVARRNKSRKGTGYGINPEFSKVLPRSDGTVAPVSKAAATTLEALRRIKRDTGEVSVVDLKVIAGMAFGNPYMPLPGKGSGPNDAAPLLTPAARRFGRVGVALEVLAKEDPMSMAELLLPEKLVSELKKLDPDDAARRVTNEILEILNTDPQNPDQWGEWVHNTRSHDYSPYMQEVAWNVESFVRWEHDQTFMRANLLWPQYQQQARPHRDTILERIYGSPVHRSGKRPSPPPSNYFTWKGFKRLVRATEVARGVLTPEDIASYTEVARGLFGARGDTRIDAIRQFTHEEAMTLEEAKAIDQALVDRDMKRLHELGVESHSIARRERQESMPPEEIEKNPEAKALRESLPEEMLIDPDGPDFLFRLAEVERWEPKIRDLADQLDTFADIEAAHKALDRMDPMDLQLFDMVAEARWDAVEMQLARIADAFHERTGSDDAGRWAREAVIDRSVDKVGDGPGENAVIDGLRPIMGRLLVHGRETGLLKIGGEDGMVLTWGDRVRTLGVSVRAARGGFDRSKNDSPLWGSDGPYGKTCSTCHEDYQNARDEIGKSKDTSARGFFGRLARVFLDRRPFAHTFSEHYLQDLNAEDIRRRERSVFGKYFANARIRVGDRMVNLVEKLFDSRYAAREEYLVRLARLKRELGHLSRDIDDGKPVEEMNDAELREFRERQLLSRALEDPSLDSMLPEKHRLAVKEMRVLLESMRRTASEHVFYNVRAQAERALQDGLAQVPEWVMRDFGPYVFGDVRAPKDVIAIVDAITSLPPGETSVVAGQTVKGWGIRDYYPHIWAKDNPHGGPVDPGSRPDADRVIMGDPDSILAGQRAEKWKFDFVHEYAARHGIVPSSKVVRNMLHRLADKDGWVPDVWWALDQYTGRMIDKIYWERFTRDFDPVVFGEYKPLLDDQAGYEDVVNLITTRVPDERADGMGAAFGSVDRQFNMRLGDVPRDAEYLVRRPDGSWKKAKVSKAEKGDWAQRMLADNWRWHRAETKLDRWNPDDPSGWTLAITNGTEMLRFRGLDAIRSSRPLMRDGGIANYSDPEAYNAIRDFVRKSTGYDLESRKFDADIQDAKFKKMIVSATDALNETFYHATLGGGINIPAMGVQILEGTIQNASSVGAKKLVETLPKMRGFVQVNTRVLLAKDPAAALEQAKIDFADTPYVKEVLPLFEQGKMRLLNLLRTNELETLTIKGAEQRKRLRDASFLSFTLGDQFTKQHLMLAGLEHLADVGTFTTKDGRRFQIDSEYHELGDVTRRGAGRISRFDMVRSLIDHTHMSLSERQQPAIFKGRVAGVVGHLGKMSSNIALQLAADLSRGARFVKEGREADLFAAQKSTRYIMGLALSYLISSQFFDRDLGGYAGVHVKDAGTLGFKAGDAVPWLKSLPPWVRMYGANFPDEIGLPGKFLVGGPGEGLPRTAAEWATRVATGAQEPEEANRDLFGGFYRNWASQFPFGPFSRQGKPIMHLLTAQRSDMNPNRPFEIREPWLVDPTGTKPRTKYRSGWDLAANLFLPGSSRSDSGAAHAAEWESQLLSMKSAAQAHRHEMLMSNDPEVVQAAREAIIQAGGRVTDSAVKKKLQRLDLPFYLKYVTGTRGNAKSKIEALIGFTKNHPLTKGEVEAFLAANLPVDPGRRQDAIEKLPRSLRSQLKAVMKNAE